MWDDILKSVFGAPVGGYGWAPPPGTLQPPMQFGSQGATDLQPPMQFGSDVGQTMNGGRYMPQSISGGNAGIPTFAGGTYEGGLSRVRPPPRLHAQGAPPPLPFLPYNPNAKGPDKGVSLYGSTPGPTVSGFKTGWSM